MKTVYAIDLDVVPSGETRTYEDLETAKRELENRLANLWNAFPGSTRTDWNGLLVETPFGSNVVKFVLRKISVPE